MFSVIFPGQGSQLVGMGKEFYEKYDLVKNLFKEADDTLSFPISKLILEGPKEELDLTANTQPAIFILSYSIFNVIKNEFNIDLNKAKYFAGHSLGEYSALSCAGFLGFSDTLKILRTRGDAMQNSVPKGQGGMVAVLGSTVEIIEKILKNNEQKFTAQIANDNSEGQIVLSGKNEDLDQLILVLKEGFIKNWPTNYNLMGWLVSLKKGGKITAHMHDLGWLSGSIYVNVPPKLQTDSGNLVVCIDENENKNENKKSIDVVTGSLCLFPSSLLHYTIPFESEENRIVLAFDMIPNL